MFIVIYKDGNQLAQPLKKPTFDQAFEMPGEKYIFIIPNSSVVPDDLYGEKGIWCYNDKNKCAFVHDGYHLTLIKQHPDKSIPKGGTTTLHFRYKNVEDVAIHIPDLSISLAITKAVREIILASKFGSWDEYQHNIADTKEIDKLKLEIQVLRRENEELRQKFIVQNATA